MMHTWPEYDVHFPLFNVGEDVSYDWLVASAKAAGIDLTGTQEEINEKLATFSALPSAAADAHAPTATVAAYAAAVFNPAASAEAFRAYADLLEEAVRHARRLAGLAQEGALVLDQADPHFVSVRVHPDHIRRLLVDGVIVRPLGGLDFAERYEPDDLLSLNDARQDFQAWVAEDASRAVLGPIYDKLIVLVPALPPPTVDPDEDPSDWVLGWGDGTAFLRLTVYGNSDFTGSFDWFYTRDEHEVRRVSDLLPLSALEQAVPGPLPDALRDVTQRMSTTHGT